MSTTDEQRLREAFDKWYDGASFADIEDLCWAGWCARQAAPVDARDALYSALEQVTNRYRLTLAGWPVRDVAETLAECDAALTRQAAAGEKT